MSSENTYTIQVIDDCNLIRDLWLCVPEVYLSSCNLSVLHLLNQMSRNSWVFERDKTETATGSCHWITNNLTVLDLAPFHKVALEIFVIKLVVQASNKHLLLDTTNLLAFFRLLAVVRPSRPIS